MRFRGILLACVFTVLTAPAAASGAAALRPPPIHWLKGEGNYTKAHRPYTAVDRIVVHVTEGSFWGSVRWLRSPRAHASSHFVISRNGRIVQLVHVSDIAWHAGNRRVNAMSVGIEHEGWTYGGGFTSAQYESSARLAAYIARRALMPIDRAHVIGHHEVPAPGGRGRGGASGHTDPGPRWRWDYYLALVRRYARGGAKLRVETALPRGPLRGVVAWRAETAGGVHRVEFVVDGRVRRVDAKAPFRFDLDTLRLADGSHVLELRAYGDGTRHDVTRRTVVVRNPAFSLTTAGAGHWRRVRGVVSLRARAWGVPAASVSLRVDGAPAMVDRRAPFSFRWDTRRARDGSHVLSLVAHAVDGRVATRRIVVVSANRPIRPKPRPRPAAPRITSQSLADGRTVSGLALWRVEVGGAVARVEFRIDGVLRGTDVQRPFTLGWDTAVETPGTHRLVATAIAGDGRRANREAAVTVAGT